MLATFELAEAGERRARRTRRRCRGVGMADDGDCVVTTDMLMDGVDFRLGVDEPERIGRKSLGVNLSDLAAMGSKPVGAVVSLALPRAADSNSRGDSTRGCCRWRRNSNARSSAATPYDARDQRHRVRTRRRSTWAEFTAVARSPCCNRAT